MKIAVLSGKGGTGKTLISVNLASVMPRSTYLDCDVEEPNGHLFFKPENLKISDISVRMPVIHHDICTGCRTCMLHCRFNALAMINQKIKVFEDVCHSCGGCALLCPEDAITERDKTIGHIQKGESEGTTVVSGFLNTGEASGVPVIRELLKHTEPRDALTVIDCPPGSACVVMESIKDADYCVLVAEPTVFGAHNLNMVYDLVTLFKKPYGVVLNKCLEGANPSEIFCLENQIPILGRIAFNEQLGKLNSDGTIVSRENRDYHDQFKALLDRVLGEVQYEAVTHS